jgi:hypothetical protein
MTAEYPQKSEISPLFERNPPPPGGDKWMRWFKNVRCGEQFDEHSVIATDFSLQMAISLQNYYAWYNQGWKMRGTEYQSAKVPARIKPHSSPILHSKPSHEEKEKEVDIRRDYPQK